jgi:murein tripeptide amidase MpaA
MMLSFLLLAVTLTADFEAGNVAGSEWLAEDRVQVQVNGEVDQDGRNRQPSWWYFRLDDVQGKTLTIDIAGLEGEYNYRKHDGSGLRHTLPAYSFDNENWRTVESAEWLTDPSRIRIRIPAGESTQLWVARQPPYSFSRLERLLDELDDRPSLARETIARTPEGRPLELLTITEPTPPGDEARPEEEKRVVWLMARQHSWESGTSWALEGALRFLVSDDPAAQRERTQTIYKILPMPDPDGVVRGGVRFNHNGYDLNRNWDTATPEKMPEITAMGRAMRDWLDSGRAIDLFLTLHNTESSSYVSGALDRSPDKEMAQYIHNQLTERTHFHSPKGLRDSLEEAPAEGRQTVHQWIALEREVPGYLIELMVDRNEKIGRPPTVADRLAFGRELAQILAEAVRR